MSQMYLETQADLDDEESLLDDATNTEAEPANNEMPILQSRFDDPHAWIFEPECD